MWLVEYITIYIVCVHGARAKNSLSRIVASGRSEHFSNSIKREEGPHQPYTGSFMLFGGPPPLVIL